MIGYIKMEMFTGRIVSTEQVDEATAVERNAVLVDEGSMNRWVTSLRELGRFEEQWTDSRKERKG
jgi:hypothetical protein